MISFEEVIVSSKKHAPGASMYGWMHVRYALPDDLTIPEYVVVGCAWDRLHNRRTDVDRRNFFTNVYFSGYCLEKVNTGLYPRDPRTGGSSSKDAFASGPNGVNLAARGAMSPQNMNFVEQLLLSLLVAWAGVQRGFKHK